MVDVRFVEDPSGVWLAEIVSTENESEKLLVAKNGKIVLRSEEYGEDVVIWEGFPEEPEPLEDLEEDDAV